MTETEYAALGLQAPPARKDPPGAPRDVASLIERAAKMNPDSEALNDGTSSYTFRTLAHAVTAATALLDAAGVRMGDRVAASLGNESNLVIAFFAAMRLGAKGYRVTVIDRLDMPGGRGSSISQGGYRFDLGPTIVTVPQVLRELWAACGRDFDRDVDLRAMDPFYEIRWQDGSNFTARQSTDAMRAEVARLSPSDLAGYDRFLKDSERRYAFGFEDLGRRSMHKLWDLIKVLPTFVALRADKSVYAHAASRVKDERLRFALSFHPLFIGGDPFHVTSMYILVSHLEKEFGVHYAMGGVAAIALAMAGLIADQGGTLRLNAEVDEILLSDGRATGVRLTDGQVLAADVVVSNTDSGHTYDR